jgi:nucleolar protein TMA23
MNAHALLTSQGWRGSGHSLHPTSDSTGLSRPLLVAQKANTLGLGKKQHKTADMWWMNAFDKSLKGLDTSAEGKVVQTVTNAGLDMVVKGGAKYVGNRGGLYASFVRGESLSGTITPEETKSESSRSSRETSPKKSRKGADLKESKEERRARKAAKRARRAQEAAAEKESTPEEPEEASLKNSETKEERRERKERKRQKLASKAAKEAELAILEKKKKRRNE